MGYLYINEFELMFYQGNGLLQSHWPHAISHKPNTYAQDSDKETEIT